MADRIYLDWNATAPLRPQAREAMAEALAMIGNPSSVHAEGRAARHALEDARAEVAALVGAEPRNVTFTSGGTEANALALSPSIQVGSDTAGFGRLLVSAVEHVSVLAGGQFGEAATTKIPVTAEGLVDLAALDRLLAAGSGRPLVSVMLAGNETGVIQPVKDVSERVHDAGGILHVDAVQALGRMPCDIATLGADLMTVSAHKIGGPKGIGALIRRNQELHFPRPLIRGGGQERGLRAGTENVAAIVGFGAAAAATRRAQEAEMRLMAALQVRLEAGLAGPTVIFGRGAPRLPNTTLFAQTGIKAETALIALDLDGIAVSSGSACSSGRIAASHVLAAMGVAPKLAAGAIRVSLGFLTTEREVDAFLAAWNRVLHALPKGRRGIAAAA